MGVIDLHAHLLPGLDDGPDRVADAVDMARRAAADGAEAVVCTPHRAARYPTTPTQVADGIAALQPALVADGVELRLLPGLEMTIEQAGRMDDVELRGASLGGAGRWLLIELPFRGWPLELTALMTGLEVRGFGVVIAHPERAESVQTSPDRLRDIVGRGALLQITAGSLTGEHGPRSQRAAVQLLRFGFAHVLASDMHSPSWRPPGISDGLAAAARALKTTPETIHWMVDEVPRAIVEGREVRPPKPGSPPSRTRRPDVPRDAPGRRPPTRT